jgi:hypothetical protein
MLALPMRAHVVMALQRIGQGMDGLSRHQLEGQGQTRQGYIVVCKCHSQSHAQVGVDAV